MTCAPTFAPAVPPGMMPAPAFVQQPQPRPLAMSPQQAMPAAPHSGQQPRQRVVRLQSEEEPAPRTGTPPAPAPAPAPLTWTPAPAVPYSAVPSLPSPEYLGVAPAAPLAPAGGPLGEWDGLHQRLHNLDPVCFQIQK